MALTIEPNEYSHCKAPMLYQLYDNNFSNLGFRYHLNIYIWSGDKNAPPQFENYRLEKKPNENGGAIFDIARFVESHLKMPPTKSYDTSVNVTTTEAVWVYCAYYFTDDVGSLPTVLFSDITLTTLGYYNYLEGVNYLSQTNYGVNYPTPFGWVMSLIEEGITEGAECIPQEVQDNLALVVSPICQNPTVDSIYTSDIYGALHAWSFRRTAVLNLIPMRVYRTKDDAEMDLVYIDGEPTANGHIDCAKVVEFAEGSQVRIKTLYDQVGTLHITKSTDFPNPILVAEILANDQYVFVGTLQDRTIVGGLASTFYADHLQRALNLGYTIPRQFYQTFEDNLCTVLEANCPTVGAGGILCFLQTDGDSDYARLNVYPDPTDGLFKQAVVNSGLFYSNQGFLATTSNSAFLTLPVPLHNFSNPETSFLAMCTEAEANVVGDLCGEVGNGMEIGITNIQLESSKIGLYRTTRNDVQVNSGTRQNYMVNNGRVGVSDYGFVSNEDDKAQTGTINAGTTPTDFPIGWAHRNDGAGITTFNGFLKCLMYADGLTEANEVLIMEALRDNIRNFSDGAECIIYDPSNGFLRGALHEKSEGMETADWILSPNDYFVAAVTTMLSTATEPSVFSGYVDSLNTYSMGTCPVSKTWGSYMIGLAQNSVASNLHLEEAVILMGGQIDIENRVYIDDGLNRYESDGVTLGNCGGINYSSQFQAARVFAGNFSAVTNEIGIYPPATDQALLRQDIFDSWKDLLEPTISSGTPSTDFPDSGYLPSSAPIKSTICPDTPYSISVYTKYVKGIQIEDDNGNFHFIDLSGYGENSTVFSIIHVNVGTDYLEEYGLNPSKQYKVWSVDLNGVRNSYQYCLSIACEPYYNPVTLAFLNRFGFWDYLCFQKKSVTSLNAERNEFQNNYLDPDLNGATYDTEQGTQRQFNNNIREVVTLNTDYISENENERYKQLFVSERVVLIESASVRYGVIIVDKAQVVKTGMNDKLVQYTLNIKKAFDDINSVNG